MTALWRRFSGALFAAAALCAVWFIGGRVEEPLEALEPPGPESLLRFEPHQLVGITIDRPDGSLQLVKVGEVWKAPGRSWRPAQSVTRRVAHQLHDLDSRARVADSTDEPGLYGLGERGTRIRLTLQDGSERSLEVGDPNPTGVSWYVRTDPDGPVYVVKKAAVDYLVKDVATFRETRLTYLDAEHAVRIRIQGRQPALEFERVAGGDWWMVAPVSGRASPDAVARILGSMGSATSQGVVQDAPPSLAPWQLESGALQVSVTLASGERVEARLGSTVPETHPELRYAWSPQHDVIYRVRAAMGESLLHPVQAYLAAVGNQPGDGATPPEH